MSDPKNTRRLVPEDPDAPPTEEEIAESARLRDALADPSVPHPDAELARSLRAAFAPDALAEDDLASLVDATLAPDEAAAAEALRDALDAPSIANDDADFARSLAAAWSPKEIPAGEHRAIIEAALGAGGGARVVPLRRTRVVRGAVAIVTGGLAIAASVLFVIQRRPPATEAPLAHARSTQPLFAEPFKSGEASARIDRIALARASDYRDNRFAKWGVR